MKPKIPAEYARRLVRRYVRKKNKAKKMYQELDELMDRIRVNAKIGEKFHVDGKVYEFVDNFSDTNTVFRAASVHRFELKENK